ncbi:hypothetical protein IT411_02400 [Candidatus Peregrinibacteria bacterium]|nr:hypothetical protein [Candidatus Peregrinibacteria bacterium]
MIKNKLKSGLLIAVTLINLIVSSLAYAADVSSQVGLGPCIIEAECLTISVPPSIPLSTPKFLNPTGGRLLAYYNYDLNQRIYISDSRKNGGFIVDVAVTDLEKTDSPGIKIPVTDIGVVSFNNDNNENISIDSVPGDPSLISLIDPDIINPDSTPFKQADLVNNFQTLPENTFSFFGTSGNMAIIDGSSPPSGGRINNYSLGMGYLFRTPADPHLNLIDGTYQMTATFTITSTP